MKNECEIVNDLLPNYVESLVSEETKKFVNEHIKNCEKCKKKLEILKEDKNKKQRREREEQKIEIDHLKKYKIIDQMYENISDQGKFKSYFEEIKKYIDNKIEES